MFVSGALPWDVPTPALPPLGGLLSMLDGKEGVRASLLLPPPVPRTAACVVLPQPTLSPTLPLSPRHAAPFTKASASPPASAPLKFGVDRLLAAEPRRGKPRDGGGEGLAPLGPRGCAADDGNRMKMRTMITKIITVLITIIVTKIILMIMIIIMIMIAIIVILIMIIIIIIIVLIVLLLLIILIVRIEIMIVIKEEC